MSENTLMIAGLDFNSIKANLKTYLSNHTSFTDHNFDGSALSALLNVLAYNTQYNSYYLNMVANDMFIDTAVLRSSILSHAKSLGYVPRSAVGARATINITLDVTSGSMPAVAILESTDRFETYINGITYSLYPVRDYTSTRSVISGGYRYTFSDVELVQGTPLTTRFLVTSSASQRFVLENTNIDSTSIQVSVFTTPTAFSGTVYTNATSVISLDSTSTVFFLQETAEGYTEIYFGDNIIGNKPDAGNLIVVNYKVVAGTLVNESNNIYLASGFTIDELSLGTDDVNAGISIVSRLDGGAEPEDESAVKLKAIHNYAGQGRAVTEEDYRFHIESIYPNVDSVNVWGGQNNNPPYYGKVFISIKPMGDTTLTTVEKTAIRDNLASRNLISIIPVIVDPEYVNVVVNSTVKFNSNLTEYNTTSLATLVKNSIYNFLDSELNQFNSFLRYSRLLKAIDETDNSIVSNITTVHLKKKITPDLTAQKMYSVQFGNAIVEGSLLSNMFTVVNPAISTEDNDDLYMKDDMSGNVHMYRLSGDGSEVVILRNVGIISYSTGNFELTNIQFASVNIGNQIEISANPVSKDVTSFNNTILVPSLVDIAVTTEVKIR